MTVVRVVTRPWVPSWDRYTWEHDASRSFGHSLTLVVQSVTGTDLVTARSLGGMPSGRRGPHRGVVDEHVTADPDHCRRRRRLECADVLCAESPHPADEAARRIEQLARRFPGCALIAVALHDSWLIGTGAPGRSLAIQTAGPRLRLLPSCLHGWLVAGHHLTELHRVTPSV